MPAHKRLPHGHAFGPFRSLSSFSHLRERLGVRDFDRGMLTLNSAAISKKLFMCGPKQIVLHKTRVPRDCVRRPEQGSSDKHKIGRFVQAAKTPTDRAATRV